MTLPLGASALPLPLSAGPMQVIAVVLMAIAAGLDVEGLYRRYGPMVLRRCRSLLGDEQEAVDAMQDVFVQLLRHRERLNPAAPSSLLWRIATNVCLNRLRSRRRRPEDPSSERLHQLAVALGEGRRNLARDLLERIFGPEPESTATIAVMFFVEGYTYEEVAEAMDMSVSGVRKRLRTLRARLPERLQMTEVTL